jgi:hypothetical protein
MDTKNIDNLNNDTFQFFINFLNASIPAFDDIFEVLEKNNGWFPLEDQAIEFLSELDPPWYTFYENKEDLFRQIYILCCGDVVVDEKLLNSFLLHATESVKQPDENIKPFVPESKQPSNHQDNIQTHEHNQESIKQPFIFLAQSLNILSLMIHGRSMCQLIIDAKDGNDKALCLAVQIDRTVLQIPYFRKRLLKAQFSNDADFLDKLSYRIKTPVLKSKMKYRTLFLTFALLDDANILHKLRHEDLLDLCVKIGVTGGKDSDFNFDVNKLKSRLKDYKKKYK